MDWSTGCQIRIALFSLAAAARLQEARLVDSEQHAALVDYC